MTRQSDAVWGSLLAAGVAYEVTAIRMKKDDRTLTRWVRRRACTTHPIGKAVFAVSWTGFAVWFAKHIIQGGL